MYNFKEIQNVINLMNFSRLFTTKFASGLNVRFTKGRNAQKGLLAHLAALFLLFLVSLGNYEKNVVLAQI